MEQSLGVKFDEDLKRRMKIRVIQLGTTIKAYLSDLVKRDLEETEQSAQKEK